MKALTGRDSEIELYRKLYECYSAFGAVMESLIQLNLEEIARLCRRYQVRQLAVFGSLLRDDFDPLRSDADFLVEFEPIPVATRMQNYLGLQKALASLLSRPVDLIENGTIKNPYILKNVSGQQQVLYAA